MTEVLQTKIDRGVKTELILDGDDVHVQRTYVPTYQKKINEFRNQKRDDSKKVWHGNKDYVPLFQLDELEYAYIRKHYGDQIFQDVPELIKIIERHFPQAKVFHGSMI